MPSTTPPASSQDVVGLIRQYVLPVGSHGDSNTQTTTTTSSPRRPVRISTSTTAQRVLDAINSSSPSSGSGTTDSADRATVTETVAFCRLLSDDTLSINSAADDCSVASSSLRRLVIVNDLSDASSSGYDNEITRVLKYANSQTTYNSIYDPFLSATDMLNNFLDAGADFLYDLPEPYCGPNTYPPVIAPGTQRTFSVWGGAATTDTTYDVGLSIGRWDAGFTEGCWYRHIQGVGTCSSGTINKVRFIRIRHPANTTVTIPLSRFFPNFVYAGTNWCN